jgi:uncharacterized repeat protein (TIGR03803 family)
LWSAISAKIGSLGCFFTAASRSLGQLLLSPDGSLYGTTRSGGDDDINCYAGCGTIYRISPSGKFKTLHFMNLPEGATLQGGFVEGPDGRFYSTATQGGANGCGTVYAFTPATSKVKVLHSFNCDGEGRFPYGRLVLATNGFFYGTTRARAQLRKRAPSIV